MRFRRRPPQPPSPLERAKSDLAAAEKQLKDADALRAAASGIALSLAERRRRAAAVRQAIGGVAAAKAVVARESQAIRDTRPETVMRTQIPEARRETIASGREAARLIKDKVDATGDNPRYTIMAAKSKQWDEQDEKWVSQGEVKGWLLFNVADSESMENHPSGSARVAEWAHYYHGVFLTEGGELKAFHGLSLPYTPGARRPYQPINLAGTSNGGDGEQPQPELQIMDYERYREVYTRQAGRPEIELRSEYAVQQQISELLDRQRVIA